VHTAETLLPDPSPSDVHIVIEKQKSPGIHQIPVELNKAGGKTLRFEISGFIKFAMRKNYYIGGMNLLLYLFL
jgi:hypothetical protein